MVSRDKAWGVLKRAILCGGLVLFGCSNDSTEAPPPGSGGTSGSGGKAGSSGSGGSSGSAGSSGGCVGTGGTAQDGGTDADVPDTAPRTITLTTYAGFAQSNLAFVAGQDGDGDWHVLSGAGGRYDLSVTTGRYGFAFVCETRVNVFQFTVSEWGEPIGGCAPASPSPLTGTVAGLGSGERATVSVGLASVPVVFPQTMYSIYPGDALWDAVVTRADATHVNRVIIERDVALSRPLVKNFDFASQGFAPTSRPLTVTGVATGELTNQGVVFYSHRGTAAGLPSSAGTGLFVPAEQLVGNDVHAVGGNAFDDAAGTSRHAVIYRRLPGDVTLILPPAFDATISVAAQSPQVRFTTTFDLAKDAVVYDSQFSQSASSAPLWWTKVSAGWLGASSRASLTFPDFSSLAGWSAAWSLADGIATRYEIAAVSSNRGIAGYHAFLGYQARAATPSGMDGLEVRFAQKRGQIIP